MNKEIQIREYIKLHFDMEYDVNWRSSDISWLDSWQYANGYARAALGKEITTSSCPTLPHMMGYLDAIGDLDKSELLKFDVIKYAIEKGIWNAG